MKKFEKTSRYYVVNLFADFILTKIGIDYLSKIEVIDFNSFFLINGGKTAQTGAPHRGCAG